MKWVTIKIKIKKESIKCHKERPFLFGKPNAPEKNAFDRGWILFPAFSILWPVPKLGSSSDILLGIVML